MVEEPGKVEYTMKITMSAKDWEELRDQLAQKWPSSELSNAVTDILSNVRKIHYSEQDALK